jgi:hypothetical protein
MEDAPKEVYIAVLKDGGFYLGGKILNAVHGSKSDDVAISDLLDDSDDCEFHVFKRIATVGPMPKAERPITRYNI